MKSVIGLSVSGRCFHFPEVVLDLTVSSHLLQHRLSGSPPGYAPRTFSSLSPLRRAFGRRLLQRRTPRPTSGQALTRRRSCHASSTICTAGSEGNPLASPPRSPDGRVA